MAILAVPVDQRVIDIDSRRFASVEKAMVELITNSDDSYSRQERNGKSADGGIRVQYERHQSGAVLVVGDRAEGMSFEQVCSILAYGGAHSPLAKGEGGGRGYFGRGLKQAIFGLGHGWIETIHQGRFSRIELFRSENGGYMYEDWGGDRAAAAKDYERLGISDGGTQITVVVENIHANIPYYRSIVEAVADNIYLRDVLLRRTVEIVNVQQGKIKESRSPVRYAEPEATLLIGPDQPGAFAFQGEEYPFTLTLKRAQGAELVLKGDARTNGLIVLSGTAVFDCQFFAFENQIGTEYLYGTVRCPALTDKLAQGVAIISDERDGLNLKEPFVEAFAQAVSQLLAPHIKEEQEKLKNLDHATTSGRTDHMIEHLLQFMNRVAVEEMGIVLPVRQEVSGEGAAFFPAIGLRFSTPFYYRPAGHEFRITLLVDVANLPADTVLSFDYAVPASMRIAPAVESLPAAALQGIEKLEWTVTGGEIGERGRIGVRVGSAWAWCDIAIAEHASRSSRGYYAGQRDRVRMGRDHGIDMFAGYEFRNLHNELERAVYSPEERKILINTGAPTVRLYVDGRGHFRDAARLLLAELFMDVISDELAKLLVDKAGKKGMPDLYRKTKQDIIRRYGSEIHLSFLSST